ncbi:7666_t:CDS:2 [Diversispora eburnea]|uniref:7666_t:CDS:1 n=1 Tax=Diversispora eburnea TaxID=1213867 RepID=A0A9N9BU61_9GLOM|nr:7666_t:CDS:2 [Diversispora eburnea]
MISFQKSVVLFFAFALVVLMLESASATSISFRAIAKRGKKPKPISDTNTTVGFTPVHIENGVWIGDTKGDCTFYSIGLGACGTYNTDAEMVYAMNWEMFDQGTPAGNPNNNPNCGTFAEVSRKVGNIVKKVIVKCVDRCHGCQFGDVDLSSTAFNQLGHPDEGRFKVDVKFLGSNVPVASPTP